MNSIQSGVSTSLYVGNVQAPENKSVSSAASAGSEAAVPAEITDGFSAGEASEMQAAPEISGKAPSADVKVSARGVDLFETAVGCSPEAAAGSAAKIAASMTGSAPLTAAGVEIEELLKNSAEVENGYHLPENFISGYYQRRIFPYQAKPSFTKTDDNMYRGMYITVDELANILRNGFETKYNTWQAAGGKGIYLTSSITEADSYIFQSVDFKKKNAIGVVFKLENGDYAKPVEDAVLNSTETIFKSDGDVPSDKIKDIYIRGQYGLESLGDILKKAENGEITPNTKWVNQFDGMFAR